MIKKKISNNLEDFFERISLFLFSSKSLIIFLLVPLGILILYTILISISIYYAIWLIISLLILTIALEGAIIFNQNIDLKNNQSNFPIEYALYFWLIDIIIFLLTWIYQESIGHFIECLSKLSQILGSIRVIFVSFIFLIISIILFLVFLLEAIFIHHLFKCSDSMSEETKLLLHKYENISLVTIFLLYSWLITFLYLFLQFILSSLISIWIFSGSKGMKGSYRLIFTNGILYHLGSLTLGSLLFPLIYIIRISSIPIQILSFISSLMDNLYVKLFSPIRKNISNNSFWSSFTWVIKSLYKLAVMIIAIEGTSFYQSFKRIHNALNPKNALIEKPKYSIHLFKMYLTAIFSILSMPLMMLIDNYFKLFRLNIENTIYILVVGFAFSWIIFYYYFILYDMIQETFLLRLCILSKNNDTNYPEILNIMKKIMYNSLEPEKLIKIN